MYNTEYTYDNGSLVPISSQPFATRSLSQAFLAADASVDSMAGCLIEAVSGSNAEIYGPDSIVSVSIERSGCNGSFSLGCVPSANVSVRMLTTVADEVMACDYFMVFMGYTGLQGEHSSRYLAFGPYFVDGSSVERGHMFTSFSAVDQMACKDMDSVVYLYSVPSDDHLYSFETHNDFLMYPSTTGVLPYEMRQQGKVYTGYRWSDVDAEGSRTVLRSYISENYPDLLVSGSAVMFGSPRSGGSFDTCGIVPSSEFGGTIDGGGVSQPVRVTLRDLVSRSALKCGANVGMNLGMMLYYYPCKSSIGTIQRSCLKAGSVKYSGWSDVSGVWISQETYASQGATYPTDYEYSIPGVHGSLISIPYDEFVSDRRLSGNTQAQFDQSWSQFVMTAIGRSSVYPFSDASGIRVSEFSIGAYNNIAYEPFDIITFADDDLASHDVMIVDATYTYNGSLSVQYSSEPVGDSVASTPGNGASTVDVGGMSSTWSFYGSTTGTSAMQIDLSRFSEVMFVVTEDESSVVVASRPFNVSDLKVGWFPIAGWYEDAEHDGKVEIRISSASGRSFTAYLSSFHVNMDDLASDAVTRVYVR